MSARSVVRPAARLAAAGAALGAADAFLVRPWRLRWGATKDE
jgi:hypothetical protein